MLCVTTSVTLVAAFNNYLPENKNIYNYVI